MIFLMKFTGRKLGAIGIMYHIEVPIEVTQIDYVNQVKEALAKLNEEYQDIHKLTWIEIKEGN